MRSSETRGIRKRGEVWWVDVMVAGERVRRPAGRTLKRALALRDRLLAEKTAARDRGPDTLFDTLAVRYLAKLRLTAKPTSLQTAESAVRRLIAHFGGRVVSALGANDLRQYQGARLTTSGPEAANKDTRYLREILRLGVEEEVISRLPFRVSLLRTPKKLPTVLTAEEVRRLLDAAEGPLRVILTLAAYTGLRAGEICALRWVDVDLEAGTAHVAARDGWSPKSHRDRLVPLNTRAVEVLREHKTCALEATGNARIFPRVPSRGSPWDPSNLSREVRRAFERAGLYDREARSGLHMLRRTFATRALGSGASIETVRQLGGWSGLGVVQRYVTSDDQAKREAVERLAL